MSRILTGDSQKLIFSTLTKVRSLIFWSYKPPRRTNSAHVACRWACEWAAWAEVALQLKFSYKIVRNIHHPTKSDEIFLKVGTPNRHSFKSKCQHLFVFLRETQLWKIKLYSRKLRMSWALSFMFKLELTIWGYRAKNW